MRPSLKDQASQNANKWAQQRKDQLERSRQSSRERTNFAAVGDIAVTGARASSASRKNMNSQERQKQQAPTQEKFRPTPPIVPVKEQKNVPIRNNVTHMTEPPKQYIPQKPPQQQNVSEASNQLRLLKHKMSTGSTNSRQGARNEFQMDKETPKNNHHQQFSPQNEWDNMPIKPMTEQKVIKKETSSYPRNKLEPLTPPQNQQQIQPRQNRGNSSRNNDEDESPIQVNKKPPLQSLQRKNSYNQEEQQPSDKKVQANRKPPVKQSKNQNKKVEYQNYDSNPFNYDNPYDDEPARATGNLEIPVPMYVDPNDEDQQLVECPEGCGRRFNEKALDRHVNICQKVFQSKRKQFNTKEHRILDSEHAQLLKQGQTKVKQDQQKPKKATKAPTIEDKPIIAPKKSKWLAQSEAFRAQIKGSSGQKLTREEEAAITQAQNQDLTQCTYCGRRFNETAAKKHISFCETKAKQNKMKQAPQKPLPSNNKNYK